MGLDAAAEERADDRLEIIVFIQIRKLSLRYLYWYYTNL